MKDTYKFRMDCLLDEKDAVTQILIEYKEQKEYGEGYRKARSYKNQIYQKIRELKAEK